MDVNKTILCVDDDEMSRTLIQKFVERSGLYNCETVHSGEECLNFISNNSVDLIILDYMLGDADGLFICKQIPSISVNPNVPVIISSTVDSHDILKQHLCENLVKVIQKPYKLEQFNRDISELLPA